MVAAPEGGPLTCRLVLLASFVRTTPRRPFRQQPVREGAHSKVGSDFCNERPAVYLSSFQRLIDRFPADFSDQCRLDYYVNYYMEAAGYGRTRKVTTEAPIK